MLKKPKPKKKKIDWSKRKKVLRIAKWKRMHSPYFQAKYASENQVLEKETESKKPKTKYSFSSDSPDTERENMDEFTDISSKKESQLRPALLTKLIKETKTPKKIIDLWLRERHHCKYDHINAAAIIVHLAQICLRAVQYHEIYNKVNGYGIVRLLRDIRNPKLINKFDIRHVSNVLWAIGVLADGNKNVHHVHGFKIIHRDFQKLGSKILDKLETDFEMRRKANLQHMCDILWSMNALNLRYHDTYKWIIQTYLKMDLDICVNPSTLSTIAVIFTQRQSQKYLREYDINKSEINKSFFFKLFNEFIDDFMIIESDIYCIMNMLWSLTYLTQPNYGLLNISNLTETEKERINDIIYKLLNVISRNHMNNFDSKSVNILIYSIILSDSPLLNACMTHDMFKDTKNSLSEVIQKLILSKSLQFIDIVNIFQSATVSKATFPNHLLTMLKETIKVQLKYAQASTKTYISLLESLDKLELLNSELVGLISSKLVKSTEEVKVVEISEYQINALLKLMIKYNMHKNLNILTNLMKKIQLEKQGWKNNYGAGMKTLNGFLLEIKEKLEKDGLIEKINEQFIIDTEKNENDNLVTTLHKLLKKIEKKLNPKVAIDSCVDKNELTDSG